MSTDVGFSDLKTSRLHIWCETREYSTEHRAPQHCMDGEGGHQIGSNIVVYKL